MRLVKFSRSLRIPLLPIAAGVLVFVSTPADASLTITPTFSASLTVAEKTAINSAISTVEADITSSSNLNVAIYFTAMSSGLGESITTIYGPTYLDFYNSFKAVATSANQLTALASLGTAPTNSSALNPVNGTATIDITAAEARNIGFSSDAGFVTVGGVTGTFDGEILLNTSITSPPNSLSGNYSLQSVAAHEIDEVLGIGGPGTTLGTSNQAAAAGALDLYRYSGSGTRSFTTSSSATSYFSINSGATALSYFNQQSGADYADWQSNPDHNGFGPQVQDAFATPGVSVSLGNNELAAFEAIGYQVITPEPSTMALVGLGLLGVGLLRRKR